MKDETRMHHFPVSTGGMKGVPPFSVSFISSVPIARAILLNIQQKHSLSLFI